uniref:Uncharacterized protein n=1 Tax=Anguilla anguilla TaxID=7936 RepID=A0A0E9VV02_ANGAN
MVYLLLQSLPAYPSLYQLGKLWFFFSFILYSITS